MNWNVRFFQTARGRCPVQEFLGEQDEATQAKALHLIRLLGTNGPYLKPPFVKKIRDKLYELRISGKVAVRILYFMIRNEYCLLHAFKKKSQKAPDRELKIAIDRMKEMI
ncbi:type II toxin-antitoxin system RelE/ParE family toxin [Candidatus Gottesmanbacteria bacterium]|nr:type II toxin-antitoxin system RelE/ParE family toxin [Candidatus Gottesmanbacteria bacterium]